MDDALYQKALAFATLAHSGQTRLSGDPYITHPQAVAQTLIDWKLDDTAIVAGLLHDTVEDGGATLTDLTKEFGPEVAKLVDGVTKITHIRLTSSVQEEFVENLRKMILVMAHDLRVVLVKLADRLHNMRTLDYLTPAKQLENARETLEIYAPLAERLGMGKIKTELEDLAFKYVHRQDYDRLVAQTAALFAQGDKYIQKFHNQLQKLLAKNHIPAQIDTRHKGLYSLYKKLSRPEIAGDLKKINDLVASRILVDTEAQCYLALGAIHAAYHPVPYLGVTDYIANPKPNGYRSIHTKIFGPLGRIIEVQIRTHLMHQEDEWGVSAHWQYTTAKTAGASDRQLESGQVSADSQKLNWVKQLVVWQKEITDSQEYLDALKFDALQHRNFIFSPKGDVYDLPWKATPIDFAYAVHTLLGHQAVGAKVNAKLVPLSHKLRNGDVVEIITDRKRKLPNHEWLDFVVTTTARHSILKALKN